MYHGVLLIDKPQGITSHDVVSKVRKILKMKSVGHGGTLDPLATGLMVVLLGEATKISDFLLNANKRYQVKVKLGIQTDSLDITGQILKSEDVSFDIEKMREAINQASGVLELEVPAYSAVKQNGKKLYELARNNHQIDLPNRKMHFFDLVENEISSNYFDFDLSCEKGGFIRSWADYVGKSLGTFGVVEKLRRIKSGEFEIQQAITLDSLQEVVTKSSNLDVLKELHSFIPIENTLPHLSAFTVSGKDEKLMKNGQVSHDLGRRLIVEKKKALACNENVSVKIFGGENFGLLSLLEVEPFGKVKIRRIFNFQ